MTSVRDIKTDFIAEVLLTNCAFLCKEFDMAEIETLWLSRIGGAHFTSESSVLSVMAE